MANNSNNHNHSNHTRVILPLPIMRRVDSPGQNHSGSGWRCQCLLHSVSFQTSLFPVSPVRPKQFQIPLYEIYILPDHIKWFELEYWLMRTRAMSWLLLCPQELEQIWTHNKCLPNVSWKNGWENNLKQRCLNFLSPKNSPGGFLLWKCPALEQHPYHWAWVRKNEKKEFSFQFRNNTELCHWIFW